MIALGKKKSVWGDTRETINRIRILTMMQLKNIKKKTNQTKGRKILSLVLSVVGFASITAVIYLFMYVMALLYQAKFFSGYQFLILYLMIMQTISIISCTAGMMQTLFLDEDNAILLSFPCRHSEVFLSKLLVFYYSEFKKNLFAVMPMIIAISFYQSSGILSDFPTFSRPMYFVWAFFSAFFLPLIPVLIGSILSLPSSIIKRFITQNSIIQVFFYLLVLALVFYLTFKIISILPDKIQVITQFQLFIAKMKEMVEKLAKYGAYLIFFVELFFSYHVLLNILYISLIVIGGGLAATFITMPFYFKIASHSMEESIDMKHKGRNVAHKGIFLSFLRKDLMITGRNMGKVVSDNLLILLMPPIILFTISIYSRMSLDESMSPFLISIFTLLFILLLCLSNNDASATAITREGSEFVLVKTAPNQTQSIAWSKIVIDILISLAFTSLSFLFLFIGLKILKISYLVEPVQFIGKFKISPIILIYIMTIFLNSGIIFHGLQLDIRSPHLEEYASTGSIKENRNVNTVEGYGIILSFVIVVLLLVSFLIFKNYLYTIAFFFSFVYLIFRLWLFKANLYAFFDNIEL